MSFGSPNNPYGQPQDPQNQQPGYGYPQQGQPGYGYPQQGVPPQGGYGYPQQPGFPGGAAPRVASMGRRFGARLIDGVIIGVIYVIFVIAGVAGAISSAKNCDPNAADYDTCLNNASSDFASKFLGIFALLALLMLLYEWLMVGLIGRTLGKMAVGLHVVNAETGGKPGLGKSFIRYIIPMVGGFVCGIGQLLVYLSPFWDKSGRQQGWHDKAAGTMVVQN